MRKKQWLKLGFFLYASVLLSASETPIVWPFPPDPARFSYVKSISGPDDMEIKRSFFGKVWDFLAGNEPKVLQAPMGLYVSPKRVLYVTDSAQQSVFVFNPSDNMMDVWEGYGDVKFGSLIDIVADERGFVYVSDTVAKCVIILDSKGKFLRKIGVERAMERPTGLAIDEKRGWLYVSDTLKGQIEVFDLSGNHLRTIGKIGNEEGEFNRPTYITVDGNGNLYVSDSMNNRIQIFDFSGKFLRMFGERGGSIGYFGSPRGIALDQEGNIYVTDSLLHAVQIFNTNGELLLVIGNYGMQKGEFSSPKDIVIDSKGMVYIADFYNMRVQMVQKLPNPETRELP